jgi:hypothetical protein
MKIKHTSFVRSSNALFLSLPSLTGLYVQHLGAEVSEKKAGSAYGMFWLPLISSAITYYCKVSGVFREASMYTIRNPKLT